jgi:hypothetical protein
VVYHPAAAERVETPAHARCDLAAVNRKGALGQANGWDKKYEKD